MNALETLEAARRMWDSQHWQTSLDFDDPASGGDYGTPTASQAILQSRSEPGPETPLVGGTIGASPPSRCVSDPFRVRPPARTTPGNPKATAANLPKVGAAVAGGDST